MDIIQSDFPLTNALPQLNSEDDFERICAILQPDKPITDEDDGFEPPDVTLEFIQRYYDFLNTRLLIGLRLTGREDMGYFGWEERFIWGTGDLKEYEVLKKKYASCQDKFLFLKLTSYDEDVGILAKVKRIKDKKLFTIPLVDLDTCTQKKKEHELIGDYATWFVNFGKG